MLSQEELDAIFEPEFEQYFIFMEETNKIVDTQPILAYETFRKLIKQKEYEQLPDAYLALARMKQKEGLTLQEAAKKAQEEDPDSQKAKQDLQKAAKAFQKAAKFCQTITRIAPGIFEAHEILTSLSGKKTEPQIKISLPDLMKHVRGLKISFKASHEFYHSLLRCTLLARPAYAALYPGLADDITGMEGADYSQSHEFYFYGISAYEVKSLVIARYYFEKAIKAFPHDFISLGYLAELNYLNASVLKDPKFKNSAISKCLEQMNYIIKEFNFMHTRVLRGTYYNNFKQPILSCNDFVEAIKHYQYEFTPHFDSKQQVIFPALEAQHKKLFLTKCAESKKAVYLKSRSLVPYYQQEGDSQFDKKNYDSALYHYSMALWFEDEGNLTTNQRTSILYLLRAHIHLILGNLPEANLNLQYAGRFKYSVADFHNDCALYELDRLVSHFLYKSNQPGHTKTKFAEYSTYLKAAEIYFNTEYGQLGLTILNHAINKFPDLPEAYYMRGTYYKAINNPESALTSIESAVKILPLNKLYLIELINIQQILKKPRTQTLNLALNSQYVFEDWYHKTPTVEQDINHSVFCFLGVQAFFDNQLNASIFMLDKVIMAQPQNVVARTYRGLANYLLNDKISAHADFNFGIERCNYPLAYLGRGLLQAADQEWKIAKQNLIKAFKILGNADLDTLEKFENPIMNCLSFIPEDELSDPDYFDKQGIDKFAANDYTHARYFFSCAIWLSNNNEKSYKYYFYRSYTFLKLGFPDKAKQDVVKAMKCAELHHIRDEDIIILKKMFATYCLTPMANLYSKVMNAAVYFNLGIFVYPTPALLFNSARQNETLGNFDAARDDTVNARKLLAMTHDCAVEDTEEDKNNITPDEIKNTNNPTPPITEQIQTGPVKNRRKKKKPAKPIIKSVSKPSKNKKHEVVATEPALLIEVKPEVPAPPLAMVEPEPVETKPKLSIRVITPEPPPLLTVKKAVDKTISMARNSKRRSRRESIRKAQALAREKAEAEIPAIAEQEEKTVLASEQSGTAVTTTQVVTPEPQTDNSAFETAGQIAAVTNDLVDWVVNHIEQITSTPTATPSPSNSPVLESTAPPTTPAAKPPALLVTVEEDTDFEALSAQIRPPNLSRLDTSDSFTAESDTFFTPRSLSSTSPTNSTADEFKVKTIDEMKQDIAAVIAARKEDPYPAELLRSIASSTVFRLNPDAIFFRPETLNAAALLPYMPTQCDLYEIEKEFIQHVALHEQTLAANGITSPDRTPCYFEVYIVGGSLTDRVITQFKKNLLAIPNPSEVLLNYLRHPMFLREAILDDHDILTTLPMQDISTIALKMGLIPLIHKSNSEQNPAEFAPKIEFLSFIKHSENGVEIKVDFVHKDVIDFALEAYERDSGLFLNRECQLKDISGFGLLDLVMGVVRLTILPTEQYHIELLKLLHTIHTSTKRYLVIHDKEIIKQCYWLQQQIQPSYINSALRKLFFPGRMLPNYYKLHEFKLFEVLYCPDMSNAMLADDAWIRSQLKISDSSPRPSLQHIHAIFLVSYVMQTILINSRHGHYNTLSAELHLQNPNIINACYCIVERLQILRDVFPDPKLLAIILEKYINNWKKAKSGLVAQFLSPMALPPQYTAQMAYFEQPTQSPPPVYYNQPLQLVAASPPPQDLERCQTAPPTYPGRNSHSFYAKSSHGRHSQVDNSRISSNTPQNRTQRR
jgi:hypothetical protein